MCSWPFAAAQIQENPFEPAFNPTASSFPGSQGSIYLEGGGEASPPKKIFTEKKHYNYFK